jgi:hypothetical protein
MIVKAELTDTFCGQANYSWVRRVELEIPDSLSDSAIVRRVKKALDLTGTRANRRENYGDMLALWNLDNNAVVLFITFEN